MNDGTPQAGADASVSARPRSFGFEVQLERVVHEAQSEFQHLLIGDTQAFGRILMLDGDLQSAESDERIYHEAIVHPAVVAHGAVRNVLVAGAGEGAVLRELLRHPGIESVLAVDIDAAVIEASRRWLPQWSEGAFDDPRVTLVIESIEATLDRVAPGSFDLVIMDVNDPVEGGPAEALFTEALFRRIAACLREGGVMAIQAGEVDPKDMANARDLMRRLRSVFTSIELAHFFVPSFLNCWGVMLCATNAGFRAVPEDLEARVEALSLAGEPWVYDALWHRAVFHLPRLFREPLHSEADLE